MLLAAAPLFAADNSILNHLLQSVESRYNGARTLQVSFQESYAGPGGRRQSEAGELYLRKPGRMRWDYTAPAGKLFLSDGKQVFFFNPATNKAEKMKLKETEDMRAPLAFLLGKLDFNKDFTNFQMKAESNSLTTVTAAPRSDKLPYKQVAFTVNPLKGYTIEKLVVTGQDNGLLSFQFANEKMNPAINDKLFRFEMPKGAQWADYSEEGQQQQPHSTR